MNKQTVSSRPNCSEYHQVPLGDMSVHNRGAAAACLADALLWRGQDVPEQGEAYIFISILKLSYCCHSRGENTLRRPLCFCVQCIHLQCFKMNDNSCNKLKSSHVAFEKLKMWKFLFHYWRLTLNSRWLSSSFVFEIKHTCMQTGWDNSFTDMNVTMQVQNI